MLELILQLLTYTKQIIYFGLVASFKIGQLIVHGIKILSDVFMNLNNSFGALIKVLLEDFYIFIYDVTQRLLFIISCLSEVLQGFFNCIVSVFEALKVFLSSIQYGITHTYNVIIGTVVKLCAGIGQLFLTIKYLILLVGSGIWFALTIVPVFVVYLCTMFTYYLGCFTDELISFSTNSIKQTKLFIVTIYDFMTDVPVESIAGLLAGFCISYVLVKFQILLYEKLLSAVELIRQNTQQIRLRIIRSLRRNPPPIQHSSSESEQSDDSSSDELEDASSGCMEDHMCIICQERNKCILMLPCRHVCICNVCNIRLRNYNRTCPICRTVVQETMKVFV